MQATGVADTGELGAEADVERRACSFAREVGVDGPRPSAVVPNRRERSSWGDGDWLTAPPLDQEGHHHVAKRYQRGERRADVSCSRLPQAT